MIYVCSGQISWLCCGYEVQKDHSCKAAEWERCEREVHMSGRAALTYIKVKDWRSHKVDWASREISRMLSYQQSRRASGDSTGSLFCFALCLGPIQSLAAAERRVLRLLGRADI